MKNLITLLCAAAFISSSLAQNPNFDIIWEEIEIDPAVLPVIEAEIGSGAKTWRVYATFDSDYELQVIYGWSNVNLSISTTSPLFQHPDGGPTSLSINENFMEFVPTINYDSWLTIGADNSENNALLINTITTQLEDWDNGAELLINDVVGTALSVLYNPDQTQNRTDDNGRVLLAQFTCAGTVDFCFNVQLRRLNPDNSIFFPLTIYNAENICHTIQGAPDMCYNDFDQNGYISMSDLLYLVSNFACEENCAIDVNGDGKTNSAELTHFLAAFGQSCE